MPLKIDFKCGEKLVINGAVLENVGPNAKLLVHNRANILREKEILKQEECSTPASRVYFALQCAYIFPSNAEHYLELFEQFLTQYVQACPSASSIADEIRGHVQAGEIYRGLKGSRRLVTHEIETMNHFNEAMARMLEEDEGAGDDDAGDGNKLEQELTDAGGAG